MKNQQEEIFDEDSDKNKVRNKGPLLKTNIRKSKDNKWLIHETIITDIKPITYFEKVFA